MLEPLARKDSSRSCTSSLLKMGAKQSVKEAATIKTSSNLVAQDERVAIVVVLNIKVNEAGTQSAAACMSKLANSRVSAKPFYVSSTTFQILRGGGYRCLPVSFFRSDTLQGVLRAIHRLDQLGSLFCVVVKLNMDEVVAAGRAQQKIRQERERKKEIKKIKRFFLKKLRRLHRLRPRQAGR